MKIVMKKCLKELGFTNLSEADEGEKAWPLRDQDASAGTPFQLVLSDWNIPKLSGLDLVQRFRQDQRFAAIPFLLITAESDKAQAMEAIKAGASNYIVKPFTLYQVKEKLEAVLKRFDR